MRKFSLARGAASLAAVLACAAMASGTAFAENYPSRPVTIVVPASAGTGADIVARQIADGLGKLWGQSVVVENKDGASGTIGANIVARAAPDGYTLCMAFLNHAIAPALYSDIPYDLTRSFTPIVRTSLAPMAFIANPGFGADTLPELIDMARRPGQPVIFFGSPGVGSVNGLSMEMLKAKTGIHLTQVPYKGNAQMVTDVMGNQVPLGVAVIGAVLPQVRAGKLKVLAVTSAKRSSNLPDVATVAEAGVQGYDVSAWNGLLAPAKTPPAVVEKIYRDVSTVVNSPDFVARLQAQSLEPALLDPQAFSRFLASELKQWAQVVKEAGVKAE